MSMDFITDYFFYSQIKFTVKSIINPLTFMRFSLIKGQGSQMRPLTPPKTPPKKKNIDEEDISESQRCPNRS